MAGITLEQAEAQLASWLAASTAVAAGQSYEIAGRSLTRVNAQHIDRMIEYWNGKAATLSQQSQGRSRSRTMAPGG